MIVIMLSNNFMNFLKSDKTLIGICVAAFLISLSYSLYFRIPPLVDARAYDRIGWNVAQGLGYREDVTVPLIADNSIIRVGPGYEFFLAAIFYIFGHRYWVVWIIQALLQGASALLMYLIAQEIFQESWAPRIGLVAAAFIAFSPDLITVSAMLLTETLGIFLACLTAYVFFKYIKNYEWRMLLMLSIVFGAATLVRTPLAFLGIPMGTYMLWHKKFIHTAILVAGVALLFAPWTIRNYSVYHAIIPTNAASGFNLYSGNHEGASGEQESFDVLAQYAEKFGYIKANDWATTEAKNFIISHPFEYLKLTMFRTSIYFSFARPTGFWFHLHGLSKALTLVTSAIFGTFIFTLGAWGIWQIRYLSEVDRKRAWLLLALLVTMPLAIVGIIVETRYRFLVYPFFAIFAAFGMHEFLSRKLRIKPAIWIALFLFANTAFDILRNWGRIIERLKGL